MAQRPPGGFGGGGKRDTPTEAIPSPFEPAPPAGSRRPASTLIGSGPSPSASRPAPLPLPPPPPPSAPFGPRPGPPGSPPQAVPLPGSPFGPTPGATARLGQGAIPVLHDGEAPGDAPTSVLVSPFGTTAGLPPSQGAAGPTRPGLGASPAPMLPVLPAVPPAPTSSPYLLPPQPQPQLQPPQLQPQPPQLQPQPLPEPSPSASARRPGTTDYGATESLPGPPRDAAEGWLGRHLRHFELAVLALLGVALLGASFAGCAASSAAERAAAHTTAGFAKLDEANAEVLASLGVADPAGAAGQGRAPALAKRREAAASFEQGQKDGQTSAKLAGLAAFFAMSLFLGALASALGPARLKLGLFGLGALVSLVSLVRLLVLALG
ncbi:MAG: hypothetical protein IT373_23780 [Polyangiaceae bacterium]|nr:hypothetical protein [Polyangiaceae bacterium]